MALAPATQLEQMALEIANHTLQRAQSLKPERLKIEKRLQEIEAVMDAAHLCHQRARDFSSEGGRSLQCPCCWILHEAKASLTRVSSDTKDDVFRCDASGQTVRIDMGL